MGFTLTLLAPNPVSEIGEAGGYNYMSKLNQIDNWCFWVVVARIAKFYFKEGKREQGFEELDLILNKQARSARGFRGYITSFSCDQDNVALILTMWEDNESFEDSKELFSSVIDKVKPFFEKLPNVEHHRIDTVNFSP